MSSLRVNLDMGKMVFSWMIRRDSKIPGTVVRASTIPEQLGRISYLLTDKTGESATFVVYRHKCVIAGRRTITAMCLCTLCIDLKRECFH